MEADVGGVKLHRIVVDAGLMILIAVSLGWVVLLPLLVVVGLSLASRILGARARRRGALDVTGLARDLAGLGLDAAQPSPDEVRRPAEPSRQPVGSGY